MGHFTRESVMQATTEPANMTDVPVRQSYRKEIARHHVRKAQCEKLQFISQMQFLDKPELELLRLDMNRNVQDEIPPPEDNPTMEISEPQFSDEIVFESMEESDKESGRHCNPRRMCQSPKFLLPLAMTSSGIAKPTGISPRSPRGSPRLRSPRYQTHYRPHSVKNEPLHLGDMQLALSSLDSNTNSLRRNYSFNEGNTKFTVPSPRSFIASPRSAFAPHNSEIRSSN